MRVQEGSNDRRLRLIILTAVVIVTIIAFYYQSLKFTQPTQTKNEITQFNPMVSVIKPMTENEYPLVAMVKMDEGKPLLLLYNINVSDHYKFETIKVVELKQQPEAIESKSPDGIWLRLGEEWFLFDMNLQARPKNENEVIVISKPVEFEVVDQTVSVFKQGKVLWSQKFTETPVSIHPLTTDDQVWLVIFKEDVVIYEN